MIKTVPVVFLSVALALGSGGCSWLFVQPVQPNYEGGYPLTCTSSVGAPVIDTIFAALDTVELASVTANSNVQHKTAVLSGATLGIVIWGASASYGYGHTSECSKAGADAQRSYRPYRWVPAPAPAYPPPALGPQLSPPVPAARPGPVPEEAAPPPKPSVIVPSAPAVPQHRDDDDPG